ncbi:MAG: sigma-54 dependent transcriptional regulator [Bacteroidales bacterium]
MAPSETARILIIDDDPDVLLTARIFLEQLDFLTTTLSDPHRIDSVLRKQSFDAILLDMNFRRGSTEGKEGLFWLKRIREEDPGAVVILMTAYGDVELAVQGIRAGAFDFILKPWQNAKLHASILSALRMRQADGEKDHYKRVVRGLAGENGSDPELILGDSPEMRKLKEQIRIVAPTDANVLILGENGTGKELVARSVHALSGRKEEAFLSVDMGAIPETLFESELFGHQKGAFTGAIADKPGRFELAHRGSLFLDEVGNLPLTMQTKLLTVLEQRTVLRIGSGTARNVDLRLISATNQDLNAQARSGDFRQDLLYRLNTIEIILPPLRARKDDIELLARHFLERAKRKYGKPELNLGARDLKALRQYDWPGNVRELQNMMVRAVILSNRGQLHRAPPGTGRWNNTRHKASLNLEDNERELIQAALMQNRGNVTRAATDLGIDRNALYRRMKKYGIQ